MLSAKCSGTVLNMMNARNASIAGIEELWEWNDDAEVKAGRSLIITMRQLVMNMAV